MGALPDFNHRSKRKAGFTLLELLAATVVLALILAMLGQVLSQVSRSWITGRGGAQYRKNAQALADFIGTELTQAAAPVGNHTPADGSNLQLLINPPGISASYRNADAIFWQAPIAAETTFGDLAVVGYFVKWEGGTPYLCRLFINPSIVDSDGAIVANPQHRIYTAASSSGWIDEPLLSNQVRPTDAASAYRGLLAPNVVGFWIRCYGPDGVELPKVFDSHVGYKYEILPPPGSGGLVEMQRQLPAVIEVSLAMVDSGYSGLLPQAETSLKTLVQGNSVTDAYSFLEALSTASAGNVSLRAILPGTRIYSKKIHVARRR